MSKRRAISPLRLACLAFVILIGAATNVLVAWAGYIAEPDPAPMVPIYRRFLESARAEPDGVFFARIDAHRFRTRISCDVFCGPSIIDESVEPDQALPGWITNEVLAQVRRPDTSLKSKSMGFNYDLAGWPWRSLCSTSVSAIDYNVPGSLTSPAPTGNWVLPPSWTTYLHTPSLPIGIIWPGFLANSALFAFGWRLLGFAVLTINRSRRRASGLCPHCAYNLAATPANAPCPECGTPTTSREGT